MQTDFESFLEIEETLGFLKVMLGEATQFSVARLPETGEWVVSWPVHARLCPDQCKAYEEEDDVV